MLGLPGAEKPEKGSVFFFLLDIHRRPIASPNRICACRVIGHYRKLEVPYRYIECGVPPQRILSIGAVAREGSQTAAEGSYSAAGAAEESHSAAVAGGEGTIPPQPTGSNPSRAFERKLFPAPATELG